jgi:hypothetical protein
VALVRNGNTWYIFTDGTQAATTSNATAMPNVSALLNISALNGSAHNYTVYYDEMRFSNTARWTSNFTPETGPYTT